MSESYYEILGVAPKSNADEIKKAYRKLSLKYHPDRNKDPNMIATYQKINEAYEVLSDDQKRRQYDMMGPNGFSGGSEPENPFKNMDDLFSEIFHTTFMPHPGFTNNQGGFPGFAFGGLGGAGGAPNIHIFRNGVPLHFQNNLQKPTPIIKNISIHISQILQGSSVPVEIERWVLQEGTKVFEKETIYVKIPQGIDDNEIIVINEKGNVSGEFSKGDIKVIIHVVNDTEIKRNGLDLIYEKKISLKEALCGFQFDLKYLNGKVYTMQNNSGNIICPEYRKLIPHMGIRRENGDTGNLIIIFHIEFPESLTEEKINSLKQIL